MRLPAALTLVVAIAFAGPGLAQTDKAACIASPDDGCLLDIALSDILASDAPGSYSFQYRDLALGLFRLDRQAEATRIFRMIAEGADRTYAAEDILLGLGPGAPDEVREVLTYGQSALHLVRALARIDDLPRASAMAETLAGETQHDAARAAVAEAMFRAGDQTGGLALADAIGGGWPDEVRVNLAVDLAAQGQVARALDLVRAVSPFYLQRAGTRLAPILGTEDLGPFLLQPAMFQSLDPEDALLMAPGFLALAEAGQGDAVLAAVAQAPDPRARIAALRLMIAAGLAPGAEADLRAALGTIADPYEAVMAELELAAASPDAAFLAEVTARFAAWPNLIDRAFLLAELARQRDDPAIARLALQAMPGIADDFDRDKELEDLAEGLVDGPAAAVIPEVLEAIDADLYRDQVIVRMAAPLARRGEAELALTVARRAESPHDRAEALAGIAAVTGDAALMQEAVGLALTRASTVYRPGTLIAIAALLHEAE
jgi:hypothetical protein